MTRRVVVVGGGIGGAGAALHLRRAGVEVVVVERTEHLGGLVVSFEVAGTPLECFYHHVFPHETDIVELIRRLGLGDKLGWFRSSVGVLREGRVWPFTSAGDLLRFGPLPPLDRVRTGLGALRLAREKDWTALDGVTALDWLEGLTGANARRVVWEPLLRARFGHAAGNVPAAWMWGRFRQRAGGRRRGREVLGYLRGGFRQLFDALEGELRREGVDLRLGEGATGILADESGVRGVAIDSVEVEADAVLYAGTLPGIERLVPEPLRDPRWGAIGRLGVLCVVVELARPLGDIYWTNVCDPLLPFGGIIEHTNLVPAEDYGGRTVVYLSRYHTLDEPVATEDPAAEAARWVDVLAEHLPGLSANEVLKVTPFRTPYAAPLPELGHLGRIPPTAAHLPGLYLSTTAQIYPEDRGMDEGLKRAIRVAEEMLGSARVSV